MNHISANIIMLTLTTALKFLLCFSRLSASLFPHHMYFHMFYHFTLYCSVYNIAERQIYFGPLAWQACIGHPELFPISLASGALSGYHLNSGNMISLLNLQITNKQPITFNTVIHMHIYIYIHSLWIYLSFLLYYTEVLK